MLAGFFMGPCVALDGESRSRFYLPFSPRRAAVSHLLHEFMTGQTPEPLAKYDRMVWRLLTTAVPIVLVFGIASWFL